MLFRTLYVINNNAQSRAQNHLHTLRFNSLTFLRFLVAVAIYYVISNGNVQHSIIKILTNILCNIWSISRANEKIETSAYLKKYFYVTRVLSVESLQLSQPSQQCYRSNQISVTYHLCIYGVIHLNDGYTNFLLHL